jgi:large subunit ribosomal protein L4
MNLEVIDLKGNKIEEFSAPEEVFGTKANQVLVHTALTHFLAAKRRGTAAALTRGEVSGGGKKPWKQKGTGRARVGSIRSPLWRHGGVIFPPKPRSYNFALPKKMRRAALAQVISDRLREGRLKVIAELNLAEAKTSEMLKILNGLKLTEGKVLIVVAEPDDKLQRAARNLSRAKLVAIPELNVFDLLNHDWLVLTKAAAGKLGEDLV